LLQPLHFCLYSVLISVSKEESENHSPVCDHRADLRYNQLFISLLIELCFSMSN
jgi:hypothetical protein